MDDATPIIGPHPDEVSVTAEAEDERASNNGDGVSKEQTENNGGKNVTTVETQSSDNNGVVETPTSCYTPSCIFNVIFCFFCFISGQLLIHWESEWSGREKIILCKKALNVIVIALSFILAGIFLIAIIYSFLFVGYAVIWCPFPNCGLIAGPYIYREKESNSNGSSIFNITSLGHRDRPTEDKGYFTFQDAVIAVATISGSLSYLIMMVYVLIINYSCCKRSAAKESMINPFFHESCSSKDFEPARLNSYQSKCFYLIFFLCLLLYFGNVVCLFLIASLEDDKHFKKSYTPIDYAGLASQLASQYCAIISCFIFSKVAYAVSLRCHEQLEKYNNIIRNRANANATNGNSPQPGMGNGAGNTPPGTGNGADTITILKDLEEKDTEYVELCNKSMKPYRLWFAIHWFLYALSSFMAIAYLVETILDRDVYKHEQYLILVYIGLFTFQHVVLFMYPCFRAATLLEARNTLIHKVSIRYDWDPNIKSKFLQFMQVQRCGFLLSLGCIRIEFGFNIAYLSIFFGFIGIIIKVFALT